MERQHWGNVNVVGRLTFRLSSRKAIGPIWSLHGIM